MTKPFKVKWKFRQLLKAEGVSVYKLANVLAGKVSRPTLYRWNSEPQENVSTEAIAWTLWGLSQLTKKTYQIQEVMEFVFKDGDRGRG